MGLLAKWKNRKPAKSQQGITWKKNSWKRKTTIFYAGDEIGYFQMKGWLSYGGQGSLLNRPFFVRSKNIWQTRFAFIDGVNDEVIATIRMNPWSYRTRLFLGDEVFIFKNNFWGNGTWWWQRENGDATTQNEKLIHTHLTNLLTGKGQFEFGNTKESNLNALILSGIFIATLKEEISASVAALAAG
ncbi:MAG: hypothetical protein AAF740_14460 [Bacteroidota bacterium]